MTQVTMLQERSCINCYHEKIEHLKCASETCTECFTKDTKEFRYPNWKEIKRG